MLAQRYPTAYDGIAAAAPGIQWTEFFPSMMWPQQFMSMLGEYPHGCELDAITAAAISACDELDGVADGIIGEVDECLQSFDPFELVGRTINCTQEERTLEISSAAAAVVNATWQGMRNSQGVQTWPGLSPGTDLAFGVATTNCSSGPCVGSPLPIAAEWLSLFVSRDVALDLSNLSHVEFDWLAHQSGQKYRSIIGTDDPDLSTFRRAGGKLVTLHGLVSSSFGYVAYTHITHGLASDNWKKNDQILPPKGTAMYYDKVLALQPDTHDFYRHFEVPGMGHCSGGASGNPTGLFNQLQLWVENGTTPEQTPVKVTDLGGRVHGRIVCPYPEKAVFDEDCRAAAETCWTCKVRPSRK